MNKFSYQFFSTDHSSSCISAARSASSYNLPSEHDRNSTLQCLGTRKEESEGEATGVAQVHHHHTRRTLVQEVHLLYVNFAKTMSVAQLDLANKVKCCLYCLFRYNRCNSFLPYSSCALHPSSYTKLLS